VENRLLSSLRVGDEVLAAATGQRDGSVPVEASKAQAHSSEDPSSAARLFQRLRDRVVEESDGKVETLRMQFDMTAPSITLGAGTLPEKAP